MNFSEGWHHLAEALQRVGRHAESAEIYTKFAKILEPEAETLYRQARSNFEVRNYLDALEAFNSLVGTFPDFAPGWSGLGQTHTQIGQPDEAIQSFEKAIDLDPTRPEPFIGLGWIELKNNRPDTAEQNFRQALWPVMRTQWRRSAVWLKSKWPNIDMMMRSKFFRAFGAIAPTISMR